MNFSIGGIYHIYNQGNNRQLLFFNRENYLYFLQKIRMHLLPYADLLAYCLMPNHFHFMVEVKEVLLPVPSPTHGVTAPHQSGSHPVSTPKPITINTSIGIMLRSYTRAINIQEHRTGALFREETKAICLNNYPLHSSLWHQSQGITYLHTSIPEWQYPQVCFNYIHNNPVKAGLVADARNWEFSSLSEIINKRPDAMVNMERIHDLGLNY